MMPKKLPTEANPYVKHYSQLICRKVIGVVRMPAGETGEEMYGLLFDDETIAWILRDPEGNGPGFLEIEGKQ